LEFLRKSERMSDDREEAEMHRPNVLNWRAIVAGLACLVALPAAAGSGANLVPLKNTGFQEAFAENGVPPTGYKSVYIRPVGITPGDEDLDKLSARDRKTMQDYFADKLQDALGEEFALVGAPGPGVLVVASWFTALRSNRVTPDQLQDKPNLDAIRSFGIGRAGIAITLTDGGNGAFLAQFADLQTGDSLPNNPHLDQVWGDAMAFSREWAGSLADLLSGK
jgi:hypothetical protein